MRGGGVKTFTDNAYTKGDGRSKICKKYADVILEHSPSIEQVWQTVLNKAVRDDIEGFVDRKG